MGIRYYRKLRGMSQRELAIKIGITQQYLCCLEKGKKSNPSLALLARIANELKVTVPNLLEQQAR